jgi:hypothetical protein
VKISLTNTLVKFYGQVVVALKALKEIPGHLVGKVLQQTETQVLKVLKAHKTHQVL